MDPKIALFALMAAVLSGNVKSNEEFCYSYAGGSVYPQPHSKGDHLLHSTKAVSKYQGKPGEIKVINSLLQFLGLLRLLKEQPL